MYEAFYKLGNDPFRLLPDPEICFPHRSCAKAWAYLRYALKRGEGIVVVTGPPGSGKTTLAERLLNELNPTKTVSVRLIANDLNPTDLLRKLAYSFGLPAEGMDRAMLAHRIERYLIELEQSHRQALVLIDEAQTLSHQSLEAMRLLTDIQSRSRPVLQLFLLGQEELEGVMCAPGMAQFQQRVIASSRLARMDLAETKAYLEYRLSFADWSGDPSINGPAVMSIYRFSRGLPRHVNKICSRLLLHGCTEEKHALKQRDVMAVVQDLRHELLAPMEDGPEATEDLSGTSFESVYELALVPSVRRPATPTPVSHDEMHALFLADDPVPPVNAGAGSPARDKPAGRSRARHAGGRYFYRVDYPRPFRFRRKIYRLFQLPGRLVGRVWGLGSHWAPVLGDALTRLGGRAMQFGVWARDSLRGRLGDASPGLVALWGRAYTSPRSTVAGLTALFAVGFVLLVWNPDDRGPQDLAHRGAVDSGQDFLTFDLDEGASNRPNLLEASTRYMDVAELPVGSSEYVSSLLGSEQTLRQGMVEADVSDYRSIMMTGDPEKLLLGRVTDDAADYLVGVIAQAATTLDVWSLANRIPEPVIAADQDLGAVSIGGAQLVAESAGFKGQREAGGAAKEDESIALIVSHETGVSLDFIRFLPAPAAGSTSASTEVSAGSGGAVDTDAGGVPSAKSEMVSTAGEQAADAVQPPAEEVVELLRDMGSTDSGMVVAQVTEAPVSAPGVSEALTEETSEVERLLSLAAEAMRRDRLSMPHERSAYNYLNQVLAIDPDNEDARSGLNRIAMRYRDLARWALDNQDFEKAGRFIERGLKVDRDNAPILAVRDELNEAIDEAEAAEMVAAELARFAMEPPKPEPVVVPEKRPENSFRRLMRFVDGFSSDGSK